MTNETLEGYYKFYKEIRETQYCVQFLQDVYSFELRAGSQYCEPPRELQDRIRIVIHNYYAELEEKQKEL